MTPKPQANKTIDELVGQASMLFYNKETKSLDGVFDEKQAGEIVAKIQALITEAEDKAMEKFGLKRGVKYDIKASETVIVITPAQLTESHDDDNCGICGDGGHSAFACPNQTKGE